MSYSKIVVELTSFLKEKDSLKPKFIKLKDKFIEDKSDENYKAIVDYCEKLMVRNKKLIGLSDILSSSTESAPVSKASDFENFISTTSSEDDKLDVIYRKIDLCRNSGFLSEDDIYEVENRYDIFDSVSDRMFFEFFDSNMEFLDATINVIVTLYTPDLFVPKLQKVTPAFYSYILPKVEEYSIDKCVPLDEAWQIKPLNTLKWLKDTNSSDIESLTRLLDDFLAAVKSTAKSTKDFLEFKRKLKKIK